MRCWLCIATNFAANHASEQTERQYSRFDKHWYCIVLYLAWLIAWSNMCILYPDVLAGFGTPRWYRPLAAADPAAWEAWLADVAAVYSALLQQQMDRAVRRPADASSEEAQGVDMELLGQAQQQQQPLQEQLADFIISLACAMR